MPLIALGLNHATPQHPVQTKDDDMAVPHAQSTAEIPGDLPSQIKGTVAHPPCRKISPHFPFLKLPPEMRLLIYEHLLVFPDNHGVHSTIELQSDTEASERCCRAERDSNLFRNRALNVLLASRDVYAEAAKVFYSGNTFTFPEYCFDRLESIFTCQAFLSTRSAFALKYIKSIEIHLNLILMNGQALDSLVKTLNSDLPAFEQLSLTIYGKCPDVRHAIWKRHPTDNQYSDPRKWLGALLELRKVKRLRISYDDMGQPYDRDWDHSEEYISTAVAFVSLLRAHLLKNADGLGKQNIQIYQRHWSSYSQERWKRRMERKAVVVCHDDENGKSLPKYPAERASPRYIGVLEKGVKEGKDPEAFEDEMRTAISDDDKCLGYSLTFRDWSHDEDLDLGMSDTEDWDMSDGGDNDSLNDIDLEEIDCSFVRDEVYLQTYHQLPD